VYIKNESKHTERMAVRAKYMTLVSAAAAAAVPDALMHMSFKSSQH
jgi:hypothetical protein